MCFDIATRVAMSANQESVFERFMKALGVLERLEHRLEHRLNEQVVVAYITKKLATQEVVRVEHYLHTQLGVAYEKIDKVSLSLYTTAIKQQQGDIHAFS